MKNKLFLSIMLLISGYTYADIPTPLGYLLLGSVNANDGVDIQCEKIGNSSTKIRCDFAQIHVNKKVSPNDLEAKNEKDLIGVFDTHPLF